ncbi:MAG: diaminopimelate epimerase [Proteobacteria bacterium]|nr:diaminopimelate epimerase [Pseudomonadota bacterium]
MLFDNSSLQLNPSNLPIRQWSNRRTGVGFDQMLVVEKDAMNHWAYRFFNADGTEAEQCGNGQRCIAHYLKHQQNSHFPLYISGKGGEVELNYKNEDDIEIIFSYKAKNHTVKHLSGFAEAAIFVDLGNPHLVIEVKSVDDFDLLACSKHLEKIYPDGINLEIVERISMNHIKIRVAERGAGETHACGSGACAAVIAASEIMKLDTLLKVSMKGGSLLVKYDMQSDHISLTGSARCVYQGEIQP